MADKLSCPESEDEDSASDSELEDDEDESELESDAWPDGCSRLTRAATAARSGSCKSFENYFPGFVANIVHTQIQTVRWSMSDLVIKLQTYSDVNSTK